MLGHRITVIRYKELEIRLLVEAAAQRGKNNPDGADLLEDAAAQIATEAHLPALGRTAEIEALAKIEANLPDGVQLEGEFRVGDRSLDGRLTKEEDVPSTGSTSCVGCR